MRWADDAGRVPVGAIISVAVLAGAGFAAYWALGEFGFLPQDESAPGTATSAAEKAGADARPEWLEGTSYELPALIETDDEDAPEMYELPEWIWEVNDDSWNLTVIREGEGDSDTSLADRQSLVIVSPTGEVFLVTDELRNDYRMSVVEWDAETDIVWMRRGGRPGLAQVTELVMPTGEGIEDWDDGAAPEANQIEDGVGNVEVLGDQPDGLELWGAYDQGGYSTGVFWRDGEEFVPSLVDERIARAALQGFSMDTGLEAWIDPEGMRAVYHGVYRDEDTDRVEDEVWIVHDLTDDSSQDVPFDAPAPGCAPVDSARKGTFEGDRIVAACGSGEYLLDLFTGQPAESR